MSDKKTIDRQNLDSFAGAPSGNERQLPTGYEGTNVPTNFSIPECNFEDLDRAMFNLFQTDIAMQVSTKTDVKKVETIFASGERFAMIQRKRQVRDEAGKLILPLISIKRTNITQERWSLPRDTGDMVIKKRLSSKDHLYQNVVNKIGLINQKNVASVENYNDADIQSGSLPGTVASRRRPYRSDPQLGKTLGDNIFEVITIPFPQFYVATYEITFWSQYFGHMNQMMEQFMNSYHAQGSQFQIKNPAKDYKFLTMLDGDFSNADNLDDRADAERILQYKFSMKSFGYLVANQMPGKPSPFRSYVSAPQITFDIIDSKQSIEDDQITPESNVDKFILNDVETLDKHGHLSAGTRQRKIEEIEKIKDPITGKDRYIKKIITNKKGESIYIFDHE